MFFISNILILNSVYTDQDSVKDNLLIVGEFQPCTDDYNPIRGEAIMESVIFQNSIDSVSIMKKYHIGQVLKSSDEIMEDNELVVMKHHRHIQFLSKPWQCAWNENKGRDRSGDVRYCFVVSVLQPYSVNIEGRYCLKLIAQFQSKLFEICCSQRRTKVEFQTNVEYQVISDDNDNDMNSESGKWSTSSVDTFMTHHISSGPPSSSVLTNNNDIGGLMKEKDLKFCHSFLDGGTIPTPTDESMNIDENIFEYLDVLRNVSFRIMKSDSMYGQMLSDRSQLPVVNENGKTSISLILPSEVCDFMVHENNMMKKFKHEEVECPQLMDCEYHDDDDD